MIKLHKGFEGCHSVSMANCTVSFAIHKGPSNKRNWQGEPNQYVSGSIMCLCDRKRQASSFQRITISNRAMILVTVFLWLCFMYFILTRYGHEDEDGDDGNGTGGGTAKPWVGDWWEFKALNRIILKGIERGTARILIISGSPRLRVRRPSLRVSLASSVTPSVAVVPSDLDPGLDPSAVVPIVTSIPETSPSYPWYLSNELVAGLSIFITLCAVYLLFSHFHDDGGDKPKGPTATSSAEISSSGIPYDKGSLSVLPSQDALPDGSSSSDDFMRWGSFGRGQGRFAVTGFRNRTYGMGCSRRFSTLVVEKVHKLRLVSPYLSSSRQLLLGSIVCCLTLYLIYSIYFSNGDRNLGPWTPKTILSYKTIWSPYNRKPLIGIKFYFQKLRSMFTGIDEIDLIEPVERTDIPKVSWTRRYILITIRMGKSSRIDENEILTRLLRVFHCRSILIGEETLVENDYCLHIGISNTNASKNTFQAYIRRVFPELEEKQLNIRARKSWTSVYKYVERMSGTFTIWTEGTIPTIVRKKEQTCAPWQENNREKHNKFTTVLKGREKKENKERETVDQPPTRRVTSREVSKLLCEKNSWDEVIVDPVLGPRLINNYLNIRNVFLDLQAHKKRKELEEMELSPLKKEILLLCYRIFDLDKTLSLRFAVISLMYLIFGFISVFFTLFFSELKEFVIDLLWRKSGPEPESEPTLNQQTPKNAVFLILFIYMVLKIWAEAS